MRIRHNKMIGGILLVSGTTVGAAMLALPVVTGLAGFLPTLLLFFFYWCYMTFTAFLILEVNLALGDHSNLISMAKKTLGRPGEVIAWTVYLFLLYLLTTAYLAGGGPTLLAFVTVLTGISLPAWAGALPFIMIFGFFVYEGTKYVDKVNRLMMGGLAISYILMAFFLVPHIEVENFTQVKWRYTLIGLSLVATSFGYHIIIPTLTTYMHHNVKELKKVIFIGSLIPLIVYILWEVMTLGVIPLGGSHGIIEGLKEGADGVQLLAKNVDSSAIVIISRFFSFFAIVTSFLGVTLSLSDFLADGLKIKKTNKGKLILLFLTFLPPTLFIFSYPKVFLTALEFAGAFGVVILLGLLPALMAYSKRYRIGLKSSFTAPGGKCALYVTVAVSLIIIGIEIANKLGFIVVL